MTYKITNYQVEEYKEKGWIKIKNFFSEKEIFEIKNKVKKFINQNSKIYKGRHINYATNKKNSKINSFHKLADSPWIKKISKNKKIKKIAETFLESKSKFIQSELFAKPSKVGLASPFHQDNFYWCLKNGPSLTIWTALDKVSNRNGGVCYFEKSHKAGLQKHVPSFAKGSSQKVAYLNKLKKYKKIVPNLNSGDILLHDSLIVHGSKKNLSNKSRMGITFQFKSIKAKIDLKMKKYYENKLKEQVKN